MPQVHELITYPVKGCAGVVVEAATLTPAGLAHDRTFMVTRPDGVFRSQRRDPRMALIRPDIDADGTRLRLSAPGAGTVDVVVDTTGPRRDVLMFRTGYRAIDQGDEVAEWLSTALGTSSRLVRVPPEHDRITSGLIPGTSGFADSCPVLLVSRSSLDLLNERIGARGDLPMTRFRPNIVVDGWDDPHTEDRVQHLSIGDTGLGFAKIAIRCVVTTIDQHAGRRAGPEPLRTLATYRRYPDGVAFGAKFAVTRPGELAVGDKVIVDGWLSAE